MNKRLGIAIMLALSIMVLVLPMTAQAAEVFTFKGQTADAFFSSVDSGCVFTDVFVFAGENVFHNPPGPKSSSSAVDLFISQFDICTETQLLAASGFASLADQDFQVSGKLTSATLSTTVEVFDFVSSTTFNVTINLTWSGAGALSRGNSHFHSQSPGCIANGHSNGSFRSAQAVGSVSDGVTNFTPDPSVGAGLSNNKSGNATIGCGF